MLPRMRAFWTSAEAEAEAMMHTFPLCKDSRI